MAWMTSEADWGSDLFAIMAAGTPRRLHRDGGAHRLWAMAALLVKRNHSIEGVPGDHGQGGSYAAERPFPETRTMAQDIQDRISSEESGRSRRPRAGVIVASAAAVLLFLGIVGAV